MNPLMGIAPLTGMMLNQGDIETDDGSFTLQPKKKGPRRLLADLLRTDPQMAEMLKKMRLGQDSGETYEDNRQ